MRGTWWLFSVSSRITHHASRAKYRFRVYQTQIGLAIIRTSYRYYQALYWTDLSWVQTNRTRIVQIIQVFTDFFIFIRVNPFDPCHLCSILCDGVCPLFISNQYKSTAQFSAYCLRWIKTGSRHHPLLKRRSKKAFTGVRLLCKGLCGAFLKLRVEICSAIEHYRCYLGQKLLAYSKGCRRFRQFSAMMPGSFRVFKIA
jgi:hypothetical protein